MRLGPQALLYRMKAEPLSVAEPLAYFRRTAWSSTKALHGQSALADCNPSVHGISCQGRWADAWSASANPLSQQEAPALRQMPCKPAHQSAQGRRQQAGQARLLFAWLDEKLICRTPVS